MARFLKYQFESKEAWEQLKSTIETEYTSPEGDVYRVLEGNTVIELGHLVVTPAVLDENDLTQIAVPAVYETAYSVDILWNDDEAEGFAPYRIYCNPETKAHTFYGLDELYEQEYNNQPQ